MQFSYYRISQRQQLNFHWSQASLTLITADDLRIAAPFSQLILPLANFYLIFGLLFSSLTNKPKPLERAIHIPYLWLEFGFSDPQDLKDLQQTEDSRVRLYSLVQVVL